MEARPNQIGNRSDPHFKPGSTAEIYSDALDVRSPGYVGLRSVVETLDEKGSAE